MFLLQNIIETYFLENSENNLSEYLLCYIVKIIIFYFSWNFWNFWNFSIFQKRKKNSKKMTFIKKTDIWTIFSILWNFTMNEARKFVFSRFYWFLRNQRRFYRHTKKQEGWFFCIYMEAIRIIYFWMDFLWVLVIFRFFF